jgi:uncharacterized membrane protein
MTRPLFSPLNLAIAIVLTVVTIYGLLVIPVGTLLPVHWNLQGEVDERLPREYALVIAPLMAAIVWGLFTLIGRFGEKGRAEAAAYMLRATLTAILILALGIEVTTVLIGMGFAVSMVHVIGLCVAVLLMLLGNAMPKSQPNSFAGIRIKTTMRDPANWLATHRLTGRLLVAAGFILALAALTIAASLPLLAILVAAVLLPMVVGTAYSLRLARRG